MATTEPADEEAAESVLSFSGARPVNVLMISWDTTRWDRLGRFDAEGGAETDTLESLFAGGVVLTDHRSCSNWTWASVLCVQNGQYDFELGWIPTSKEKYQVPVPDEHQMAGEVLRDAGYQTAMAATNAWFSPNHNMTQGITHAEYNNDADGEWVVDTALAFFNSGDIDQGEPWYVHAHFMDPHIPYQPPDEYTGGLKALEEIPYNLERRAGYQELERAWPEMSEEEQALAVAHLEVLYRATLASADDQVARLLAELEARGALEDTLIVFWTDHGEQHFEHEILGHGATLHEQENRTGAVFHAPGLQPLSWTGPTTHADIWPIALSALALPAPTSWTGLPLGERAEDSPRFAMRHDGANDRIVQSVEREGVKLIYHWDGEKELYRLADDPDELENVYASDDPDVIALWEALLPVVEAAEGILPDWSPTDPGP